MEVLIPLAFGGFMVAAMTGVLVYGQYRTKTRRKVWADVAATLGLHYAEDRMWGAIRGQPVECRIEARGSGKNRTYWTVAVAPLRPQLDLGLAVRRAGLLAKAGESLLGIEDVKVGDAVFDAAFSLGGDEPARVAALLSPELRAALLASPAKDRTLSMNDSGVRLDYHGTISDESWLRWALAHVVELAQLTQRSRAAVPAASPLAAQVPLWESFARAQGLQLMAAPLVMWGRLEGCDVDVYAVRTAKLSYVLEVLARYPQPLGIDLVVRRPQAFDGLAALFGGQDLSVGDREFDARFVVKSSQPALAAQALSPQVRQAALALLARGLEVTVRDDGVAIRTTGFPATPQETLVDVRDAVTVAQLVNEAALQAQAAQVGPYR
jgi:hypothetical protein